MVLNHVLASGPVRYVLLALAFVLSVAWNAGLVLRAEMREVDYIDATDNKWKHTHYSLWHIVSCSDWDDNYEGSQQPVRCKVAWFGRPGMVLGIIGFLLTIVSALAWMCQCCGGADANKAIDISQASDAKAGGFVDRLKTERKCQLGASVFFGGVLLLIGWIVVLVDDSLKGELPSDAKPLPNGVAAREEIHPTRWWYGMLNPPFIWSLAALIWFYRGPIQ